MKNLTAKKLSNIFHLIIIIFTVLPVLSMIFDSTVTNVYAGEVENNIDKYNFEDIDKTLDNELSIDLDFKELVTNIISGGTKNVGTNAISQLKTILLKELTGNKIAIVQVIILAIISAVFTNFASALKSSQISDTGFTVTIIAMITILLSAFTLASSLSQNTIGSVDKFIKTLIPVYFSCVAMSSGSISTIAYYQIILCVIAIVNWVFLNIVVKGSYIYVVLSMSNSITKEDNLSKLAELIKTVLSWISKTSLVIVIGINSIQSLVLPMADSMKTNLLNKSLSIIPGIGNSVSALSSTVIGAGTIVKNGVGVAALVIIVIISLIPVVKLAIFVITYRFIGAMVQPITDKRIVKCITGVSDGINMLLMAVMYSAIMFLITIAIICASTNASYFSS